MHCDEANPSMQRRKREETDVKNCVRGSSASPTGLTAHIHVPVYSHVRCPTVLPWLEPPIWLEQAQCRPEHGNKRAVHQPWETILQRHRDFLFFTLCSITCSSCVIRRAHRERGTFPFKRSRADRAPSHFTMSSGLDFCWVIAPH